MCGGVKRGVLAPVVRELQQLINPDQPGLFGMEHLFMADCVKTSPQAINRTVCLKLALWPSDCKSLSLTPQPRLRSGLLAFRGGWTRPNTLGRARLTAALFRDLLLYSHIYNRK